MGNYVSDEEQQRRKELNELLANPPPPPPPQPKAVEPKPKPQMHAAVGVAERGFRQSAGQLLAAHLVEMRVAVKAHAGSHFGTAPRGTVSEGMEELKRVWALVAYWREVARFAEAAGNELETVNNRTWAEEKERFEKTKADRVKNGWRWSVGESTADLRRALNCEVEREKEKTR